MRIRDLGLLAAAVYDSYPNKAGYGVIRFKAAGGRTNGFQAAAFACGPYTVVAFRGTDQAADGAADLALGVGMNSTYFSQGEEFVQSLSPNSKIVLCGHSLGGAIAQVVANRRGYPMVTFNAPGVGVFASREIGEASLGMTAIRTTGMLASAIVHPMQAARDIKATFNRVRGLNVCLQNDVVSRIGLHYGPVRRIPGTSSNPKTEHGIATVNTVLAKDQVGSISVASFG